MPIIDIDRFKGVITHADPEDITNDYLTVFKNLRPVNGRAEKTYGIGVLIDSAIADASNIATYLNANLDRPNYESSETHDYIYIAVVINDSTNVVTLYQWVEASKTWVNFSTPSDFSIPDTFYHKNDWNPIILDGTTLRVLPGNLSVVGASECKGIWCDWIDRDFFDGLFVTPGDYTAQFFCEPTNIVAPTLSIITSGLDLYFASAPFGANEVLYYKMSYIYDGGQESLLSEQTYGLTVSAAHNWLNGSFTITKASHNKRITGIKLYRSTDFVGNYKLAYLIDLLRPSTKVVTHANAGKYGKNYAYIPGLAEGAGSAYSFDAGVAYYLFLKGVQYNIVNPGTGYHTLLEFDSTTVTTDLWDYAWSLNNQVGDTEFASGTTGAFTGVNTIILPDEALATGKYIGGVISYNSGAQTRILDDNSGDAVHATATFGAASSTGAYRVMSWTDGIYNFIDSGNDVTLYLYDTGVTPGALHPLLGSPSVNVNSEFAIMVGGRLFQANLILNPGSESETLPNYGSYSEVGQPDVNPVGNIFPVNIGRGGTITGLQEVYQNPVYLTTQGLIRVDITTYPDEPSKWTFSEAVHRIGNIAKQGAITIRDNLFVCSYDGIYMLSPNNLAETDRTPLDRLRVSEAINDVYEALTLAQKQAIKASYNAKWGEAMFLLGTALWAYEMDEGTWREINTGQTVGIFSFDENGQSMMWDSGDTKFYDFDYDETVGIHIKTKTFVMSYDFEAVLRKIDITYKSATALTLNVFEETDIASGDIQKDVTYYVNDYTNVTYNGMTYTTTQTFTGVDSVNTYVATGTGTVQILQIHTLPVATNTNTYTVYPRFQALRFIVEIVDATLTTTDTEINRIRIEHD